MKKMLTVFVLIAMSTAYSITTVAQQRQWRPGDGSGMFPVNIQREQNPGIVQQNLYGAMFGSDAESFRIYRNLDNFPAWEIRAVTEREMSRQLGAPFDRTNPGRYTVTYEYYKLGGGYDAATGLNTLDANQLWATYEDGYIFDSSTDHSIHYGNPLTFATYLSTPNREQKIWMIAVITDSQTGRSVKLRANCGNVLRPKGSQVVYQQPAPTQYVPPVQQYVPPVQQQYVQQIPDCRILNFKAAPKKIKKGETTVLTWNTTCESVTITTSTGQTLGQGLPGSGTLPVTLEATTTFVLVTSTGNAMETVEVKGGSFWKTAAIVVGSAAVIVGGVYLVKALTKGSGNNNPPPGRTGPEQGPSGNYPNNWDQNNPGPQPNPTDPWTY